MGTKVGSRYVAGDRNSCRYALTSAADQLAAVPHHAGANVPGVATVALCRDLPVPHCHGDKLGVGFHLGPTGWMDWHTPEHGRRRVLVPAGSLSLVPRRTSVWWQRDRPSEFLLVALEPRFVADASGRGEEITWCLVPVFQDPMIAHMLSALRTEVRDGCLSGRPYSTSLCTALAVHLVRRYAAAAPAEPRKGGLAPDRLRRVLDHIEGHLSDAIRLTQLAEVARLSSAHFSTQFRRSTGLSPHRYVLQRRIKRAKELLAAGHMSLAEIGYALGFPSQAHFTTTFRKLVGTTPGAYRDGFSHFGSEIVQETRNQPADYERPETAFAAILTQGSLRSQWSMPG
jgi:AraC family transcriptional regulator